MQNENKSPRLLTLKRDMLMIHRCLPNIDNLTIFNHEVDGNFTKAFLFKFPAYPRQVILNRSPGGAGHFFFFPFFFALLKAIAMACSCDFPRCISSRMLSDITF